MKLFVKSMVSQRCKMAVKQELEKLKIEYLMVDLGVVEILKDITKDQRNTLNTNLKSSGLELLDDSRTILVEGIKNVITEMIHHQTEESKVNYSDLISEKMGYDYTYLSNVFSEVKGMTIQQFIILNKVERIKELIAYGELTLTEIAYRLHYSSLAHLSNQFKKTTGKSPSYYKRTAKIKRGNLEDL